MLVITEEHNALACYPKMYGSYGIRSAGGDVRDCQGMGLSLCMVTHFISGILRSLIKEEVVISFMSSMYRGT